MSHRKHKHVDKPNEGPNGAPDLVLHESTVALDNLQDNTDESKDLHQDSMILVEKELDSFRFNREYLVSVESVRNAHVSTNCEPIPV